MSNRAFLTREGRNKLIDEMERLVKRRPEISKEIERAREHGDLKENAEYHAAKETLTNLQRRIAEIESKLRNSQLLEDQNIGTDKVYIGAKVTFREIPGGDETTYTIVDVEESNPSEGKISVQSPLAQGLLGRKVGEKTKIELPAAKLDVQIIKIER